jgi:hypothetical protein
MVAIRVYDEMIDFITSAPRPEEIISFAPSEKSQKRLEDLQFKRREKGLTDDELHELEQFIMVEHIMRMAKAKAKQRLAA